MLILIIGDFGVGKDTIADMFVEYLGEDAVKIKSWTTRPPRYEGEDTHLFLEERDPSYNESIIAFCTIGGYDYWTEAYQFDQKKYEFYVIDKNSVPQVLENYTNPIFIIEIKRPDHLIDVDESRLNRVRIDDDYTDCSHFHSNIVYNNSGQDLDDLKDDVAMMAEMIKHIFE